MTDIHVEDIAAFRNGERRLMRVTQPGSFMVTSKEGPVAKTFAAGDVLLADAVGHVIVMPIDMPQAVAIATAVIEGNERVATDTNSLRALAVAVLAIHHSQPSSPEPVEAAMWSPITEGALS